MIIPSRNLAGRGKDDMTWQFTWEQNNDDIGLVCISQFLRNCFLETFKYVSFYNLDIQFLKTH
jgi:hypothetical protein